MRVLLIAYACEPNRGSEPGVGWHWALNLSTNKQKEVYVLTRSNNKELIDAYWTDSKCPDNLHFFYYDLSKPLTWAKHHGLPVNLYYAWWLIGSVNYAKQLHALYHFDMAHHITFGVFRDPCPLYKLSIPYVLGPYGGGDTTPSELMCLYSWKERLIERLRGAMNRMALLSPMLCKCFDHAFLILAKTKDTKNMLPKWNDKTVVYLEIGIKSVHKTIAERDKELFIYVGRFIYLKGIKLVLKAFKQYAQKHPSARLIMIGKGEMEDYIKQYSITHHLNIEIVPWIKQEDLKQYYSTAGAMLFPSLHDSSGNVVLEAISFGLPVICLDCGGPASVLGETLKELIVETKNNDASNVVNGIVEKMDYISTDEELRKKISEKCIIRAQEMLWHNTVTNSYNLIESIV